MEWPTLVWRVRDSLTNFCTPDCGRGSGGGAAAPSPVGPAGRAGALRRSTTCDRQGEWPSPRSGPGVSCNELLTRDTSNGLSARNPWGSPLRKTLEGPTGLTFWQAVSAQETPSLCPPDGREWKRSKANPMPFKRNSRQTLCLQRVRLLKGGLGRGFTSYTPCPPVPRPGKR